MKVLHLSAGDSSGGAARAAYRLHRGLLGLGIDSSMLVLRRTSGDPTVTQLRFSPRLLTRLRRTLRRRAIARDFQPCRRSLPAGFELFSDDRTEPGFDLIEQLPPCDLINLHWIGGFLDYGLFFRHAPAVPIVWRLADMHPFTGGCHYDGNCGKFTARCGACPILGSTVDNDLSRQVWQRKHVALAHLADHRLHLVGTSRWITAQANSSSLLGRFPSTVIPNGLDTSVFSPRGKTACRQKLNIPQDSQVVLFVAESAAIKRKGFDQLADAVKRLIGRPNLFLLSVGSAAVDVPGVPQLHLDRIREDDRLAEVYTAADLFVMPSLQESFGQTVTEAMACGTPVVGFNTGGIPDMVRPGITGSLAAVGDSNALAIEIAALLDQPAKLEEMSSTCRQIAVDEYSLAVQAKAYEKLYTSLLTRSR